MLINFNLISTNIDLVGICICMVYVTCSHSYTLYSEVAQLLLSLASAVMSVPAHIHSILICTTARSNRYRISIFHSLLLNKPLFVNEVLKECVNQQYISTM